MYFGVPFWHFNTICTYLSKKKKVCNLDIEKAYDHVDWNFLLPVTKKMEFGLKSRKWIHFSIVRMSIVVNVSPSDFFQTSRGLWQGDPLSPYLFMIVMEALHCILSRAD